MIVTLSGITGTGKSFYKNAISEELDFKNLVIVTTRKKRDGEINGIDKEFVTNEEFDKMVKNNEISVHFEFLGSKYGYKKNKLESNENQVTEVHYSTIYDIKKHAQNVFSIYIIPNKIERAKEELKKRKLPIEVEFNRLKEIDEHIKEYENNKDLQKQFDCVFINDYTEQAKNNLLKIIKERICLNIN